MKYDLQRLFEKHGVPYGDVNRRGWMPVGTCPKCGGADRLAWHPGHQRFFCWMCKGQPTVETVAHLLGQPLGNVFKLLERFPLFYTPGEVEVERPKGGAAKQLYPNGTGRPTPGVTNYLVRRGFDPDRVRAEFGDFYATPGHAPELPNRLIAPLYYQGRAVSWQARAIAPNCPKPLRYHTCPPEKEITYHKNLVYGLDSVRGDTGVVVEGLFDCWKLGPGAVHTFGVAWLPAQLSVLVKRFKRLFVMYDSQGPADPLGDAQAQGVALAQAASLLGVEAYAVDAESAKDPGDLTVEEARNVMQELGVGL